MINILKKEQQDEDKKLDWCKVRSGLKACQNLQGLEEAAKALRGLKKQTKSNSRGAAAAP